MKLIKTCKDLIIIDRVLFTTRNTLLLFFFFFSMTITAQDWHDLKGEWKGLTRSVIVGGDNGHFIDIETLKPTFSEVEITLIWNEQSNGRYIGYHSSGDHEEVIIGVASAHNPDIFHTVDHNGYSMGTMINDNQFELCYTETNIENGKQLASCVIFERQK